MKLYKIHLIYNSETRQERNDTITVKSINKRQAKVEAMNRAIQHNNRGGDSIGVVGIEKQSKYIGMGNWSYKQLNIGR
jgi:chorismate synthase|tara:strand:+ start:166 stop:399 length:234 start_codon:yes stop_codon:yes gene_type:complete